MHCFMHHTGSQRSLLHTAGHDVNIPNGSRRPQKARSILPNAIFAIRALPFTMHAPEDAALSLELGARHLRWRLVEGETFR
jgi:hypothetical protein